MHRLGLVILLAGCGGNLYASTLSWESAANLQMRADRQAYQRHSKARLCEIEGRGITVEGKLSPRGVWRYRYSSPSGSFEVALHGDGQSECTQLRQNPKGRLPKYSLDSPKAIRLARPKRFPTDLTLVASGSTPYWIIEGKWVKALD